jgi:hypothetical protein
MYAANSVSFAATATPVRANWRSELNRAVAPVNRGDSDRTFVEGFHAITLTIASGDTSIVHQTTSPSTPFAVQMLDVNDLGYENRTDGQFGLAHLATPVPPPVSTFAERVPAQVSFAVSVAGASTAAVSAEIRCSLRPQAWAEWQNTVYDMLLSSWREWDRQWRVQQQGLGTQMGVFDASSPERNRQVITEELKRQVVAWLLDEPDFAGRDAMTISVPPSPWNRYSITTARDTAPIIQFLEQALEWGNLTYVAYPYYWAGGSARWDDLAAIEGTDPMFVAFLRSGSARVVVPARPGFELAVLHWLVYQQPFFGDPMPLPDEDLYVSIATEIRDLTRPPEDGDAGDCWEARLPTTLMFLEDEALLPHNEARRLGKAPHLPTDPYCRDEADDRMVAQAMPDLAAAPAPRDGE